MLYTNEPANKIMVALSAYRATNSEHTNKQRQLVLLNALKAGGFEILDDNMIGCYREEGQAEHSIEESVMILCNDMLEVGLIARLAKEGFQQDCILAVTTQTHSARFVTYNDDGQVIISKVMGSLQQVDEDSLDNLEGFTKDSTGNYWSVIA
ncbi:hypothetical protein [Providencia phage PSTRCR_120]|uniref:Uncharacterized protein n=1 Tax=Providencia phage PSTRCR_120 TaxID=2800826 RepID=A0A7T6ZLY7_9CAUD|nr:hypothetical protein [Providencia phage PSTRCR_120]